MSMVRIQIALGILLTIIGLLVVAWVGVNEPKRLEESTLNWEARRIEYGAELFERNCITCHGMDAQGVPGLAPPLNSRELLEQRAAEMGWPGDAFGYIVKTVEGGRLISSRPDQYVGNMPKGDMAMPPWGEQFGGPLTQFDIENIALFLLNFEEFTPEQQAMIEAAQQTETGGEEAAGGGEASLEERAIQILINNGCGGCHTMQDVAGMAGTVGPELTNIGAVAANRIADPNYTGEATTPEEYILEAIVNPNAYVVEGFPANVMPQNFGETLSEEDINTLVEYLSSRK
nr:c-type cytochrome [Ardenticatena sp.]